MQKSFTVEYAEARKEWTAEEVTAFRREQRKQFKNERAQALATAASEAEVFFQEKGIPATPLPEGSLVPKPNYELPLPSKLRTSGQEEDSVDMSNLLVDDMEHLQLTLPEAFFLTWTLGCLDILDPQSAGNQPLIHALY